MIKIEHPQNPAFSQLGLKYSAFNIAIDRKLMTAGLEYTLILITEPHVVADIAATLLERHHTAKSIAEMFSLNSDDDTWYEIAFCELCRAIAYSFRKAGVHIISNEAKLRDRSISCRHNEYRSRGLVSGNESFK
jgi:nitric-oxide synthase